MSLAARERGGVWEGEEGAGAAPLRLEVVAAPRRRLKCSRLGRPGALLLHHLSSSNPTSSTTSTTSTSSSSGAAGVGSGSGESPTPGLLPGVSGGAGSGGWALQPMPPLDPCLRDIPVPTLFIGRVYAPIPAGRCAGVCVCVRGSGPGAGGREAGLHDPCMHDLHSLATPGLAGSSSSRAWGSLLPVEPP